MAIIISRLIASLGLLLLVVVYALPSKSFHIKEGACLSQIDDEDRRSYKIMKVEEDSVVVLESAEKLDLSENYETYTRKEFLQKFEREYHVCPLPMPLDYKKRK